MGCRADFVALPWADRDSRLAQMAMKVAMWLVLLTAVASAIFFASKFFSESKSSLMHMCMHLEGVLGPLPRLAFLRGGGACYPL